MIKEYISTPMSVTCGDELVELFWRPRDEKLPNESARVINKESLAKDLEIDEDLGLPIVQKPTIQEKYGVYIDPDTNDFHRSLQSFFDRTGFLTEKQLKALR